MLLPLVLLFFKEAYGPPLGRSAYTGARPETRAVTNGGA